jgi:hypothetical protein
MRVNINIPRVNFNEPQPYGKIQCTVMEWRIARHAFTVAWFEKPRLDTLSRTDCDLPSWEANRFAASQEIPRILWNPEDSLPHTQVPATCPYSQPARSSPHPHIPHLNIILPSTPGSPKLSVTLRFPHQNRVYASTLPISATCPAHLILLDFITRKILGEEYR